jgi:hypothetical protein
MFGMSLPKSLLIMALILALFVGIAILLYLAVGEQLVREIYAGQSSAILNSFISQQDDFPVEHYLQIVRDTFWLRIVGFPLTIFFAIVIFFLFRYLFLKIDEPEASPGVQPLRLRYDLLVALGAYGLMTLIYFHPCLANINTHLIGPPEDNMAGFWDCWWAHDKVLCGGQSLTSTSFLFYPEGSSLYYVAWSFYNLLLLVPLRWFLGGVASFNIVILHSFPLAGLGAFLLIRYLTRNSWLALLGGFLYAFSPFHFARAQHHLHINTLQFVPFFVLFYIKAIRVGTVRNLVLASLFFLLNALADWNYLFFAGYFVLFSYLYLAVRRHRFLLPDVLGKSLVVVLVPLLLLSPWLLQMVKVGLANPEVNLPGHNSFVTDLVGLIVPGQYHWLNNIGLIDQVNHTYSGNPWEIASYLGLVSLAIVVIAFRRLVRSAAPWFIGGLAFLLMAMGTNPHVAGNILPIRLPDQVLSQLPFLSNLRCPARFMTYVYLFWSIVVVLAVRRLIGSAKTRAGKSLLAVLLPMLLFADYFAVCGDMTPVAAPPAYRAVASDTSSYGILNLPEGYQESCRYMMYQTVHGIPIANGAITRKIGKSMIDRLDTLDLANQHRQLFAGRAKYIVIHKDLPSERFLDLTGYRREYPQIYEDERSLVLRVY